MRKICILVLLLTFKMYSFGQSGRNYIKPIGKDGFVVDSILSVKGNTISYLRAGTEFDIPKDQVNYIEHSIIGRIDVSDKTIATKHELAIPEPDFNGEAYICSFEDNSYVKMEKTIGQVKVKDQFWGPEKKLYVKPAKSPVRVKNGHLSVILRVPNINDDPYSFVKISRFSTSITRKLSLARQNDLTGKITYGGYNGQEIDYEAKKYGTSSFLLSFDINVDGEYCITISNPNMIDEKLSVSCFGVDGVGSEHQSQSSIDASEEYY